MLFLFLPNFLYFCVDNQKIKSMLSVPIQNTELEKLLFSLALQRFDNDWDKLSLFLLALLQKELSISKSLKPSRSFDDFSNRWKGFLNTPEKNWKMARLSDLERKHQ